MRRLLVLAVLVVSCLPVAAHAQPTGCFDVPGITNCIAPQFLSYWQLNGGVLSIGYPITEARREVNTDTGGTYLTQWFERERFEYHPENKPPFDILLGRLGDQRLRALGRSWRAEGREAGPLPGCLWFEETGHNVCNQGINQYGPDGFKLIWEIGGLGPNCGLLHGVEQESCSAAALRFLGLPLTTAAYETNGDHDYVLTQWFERARLEWHERGSGYGSVMFGRLGAELIFTGHG